MNDNKVPDELQPGSMDWAPQEPNAWCRRHYPCAPEWPKRLAECDPSSGSSCTACGPGETCSTAPEALP